jgi:hypothetical protein
MNKKMLFIKKKEKNLFVNNIVLYLKENKGEVKNFYYYGKISEYLKFSNI